MVALRTVLLVLILLVAGTESALAARCNVIVDGKLRTFEYGKVPLRSIFIRADGDAALADGSERHPYPSLYRAQLAGILPGDELVIQGDVYNTWEGTTEMLLQGTEEHPIFIRGDRNGRLFGSIKTWLHALKLSAGSRYVYIHDLEIRDGGGHALHMNYVQNIVLDHVSVFNAREAAFKLSQSRNIFVRDSEFAGGGYYPDGNPVSTQVVDFVTVTNFYIVRSKIHDGRHALLAVKGPAENGFIAWNDIYDQHDTEEAALTLGAYTGYPIIPANAIYEGKNLVAFGNNIYQAAVPFSFRGCHRCAALNNNFQGSGPQLIRYLAGNAGVSTGLSYSETNNSIFKGNIVAGGNINVPIMQCEDGHLGHGNVAEQNIFYNPSGNNTWWCSSVPQDASDILNFNPQLSADGHAMNHRVAAIRGPADYSNVPFSDLFIVDKAGACYGPPPYNVGPYILSGA